MSIRKRYYKTKPFCTVTFKLDKAAAESADKASILGEFNNWERTAAPMKKLKDGSFTANVNLDTGRDYQFRYLLDGRIWRNDPEADKFLPTQYHDAENSVVHV
jgi:1,4-alpha-glucan branching enzyme